MKITRRSFLATSGAAAVVRPSPGVAGPPALLIEPDGPDVRVSLNGSPAWMLRAATFGTAARLVASAQAVEISGGSLPSGETLSLRLDFAVRRGEWVVRLSWSGTVTGELHGTEVPLRPVMAGASWVCAPLPPATARRLLGGASAALAQVPQRVRVGLTCLVDGVGGPGTAVDLAGVGRLRLPRGVTAGALRLAPPPRCAPTGWCADLLQPTLPSELSLGRGRRSRVSLRVARGAVASLVAGSEPLRIAGDLVMVAEMDESVEGPVRASAALVGEHGDESTCVLEVYRGHWTLEAHRHLFGVSGADGAGGIRATIRTKSGRISDFDVPLNLHDHGLAVPGTDFGRLDFDKTRFRLALPDLCHGGGVWTLPVGTGPADALTIPLEGATLRISETGSLMNLRFRFKDFDLVTTTKGSRLVPRRALTGETATDPLMVVEFPPQHAMERVYLRQAVVPPDRDVAVDASLLAALRGPSPAAARPKIFDQKLKDEDDDVALSAVPEDQRPFRSFASGWKEANQATRPDLVPWIGQVGLSSAADRQLARRYAEGRRQGDLERLQKDLRGPIADADTLFRRAVFLLDLPVLGASPQTLRGFAESAPDADAAVAAIVIKAAQSAQEVKRLNDNWLAWATAANLPKGPFVTSWWPVEISKQAKLDALLPASLVGHAPKRVPDDVAARFLADHVVASALDANAPEREPFARPNDVRLAGPSRLAFAVTAPVDVTKECLTDWKAFELRVVRRAYRPYRWKGTGRERRRVTEDRIAEVLRFQGLLDGVPTPAAAAERMRRIRCSISAPPGDFETALEVPTRLLLSPAQDSVWSTPRPLPRNISGAFAPEETVPLWRAEFHERDPDNPSLRAVWSPDLVPGSFGGGERPPDDGPFAPWDPAETFRTAIAPLDRHELVGLTSIYGLPALARIGADGSLHRSQARIPPEYAFSDLADPDQVSIYLPQAMTPRSLSLSPLGASLDLDVSFVPPAAAKASGMKAEDYLYGTFGLARLEIEMDYGVDELVEIVRKGFLFPLGHQAAYVSTTRREIVPAPLLVEPNRVRLAAYPIQRLSVRVTRPEQLYGASWQRNEGRGLPARSIRLLTLSTPDLVDPRTGGSTQTGGSVVETASGRLSGIAGLAFWPRTRRSSAGNVPFRMRIDGRAEPVQMPLIFVDNAAANNEASVEALKNYYNRSEREAGPPGDAARFNVVAHGGTTRTYAAAYKPGDTDYATDWQEIDAEGRSGPRPFAFDPVLAGADQPPFFPRLRMAQIRARQIGQLTGLPAPAVLVAYGAGYLENGFKREVGDTPMPLRFLEVMGDRPTFGMGQNGDRVGATGRPSFQVAGFSRQYGPVSEGASTALVLRRGPTRYAARHDLASDASAPAAGDPGSYKPFDDGASLLGLIKLNDLVKVLATGSAVPALKEVTEFVEAEGAQTVARVREVILQLKSGYERAGGRDAGYEALGDRIDELDLALGVIPSTGPAASPEKLPGLLANAWTSGQHLADELRRLAKAPLAPAIDKTITKLNDVVTAWRDALGNLNPQEAFRRASAVAVAELASNQAWGRAIVSAASASGLAQTDADKVTAAIDAAAGDPAVWLAADPLEALATRARSQLEPVLRDRVQAKLLEGPLFDEFQKLLTAASRTATADFGDVIVALGADIAATGALVARFDKLSAVADQLCARGTSALGSWIAAVGPAPVDANALRTVADAAQAVSSLPGSLGDLVRDRPEAVREAAASVIAWSTAQGAALVAVSDRLARNAKAFESARDELSKRITANACAAADGLARDVERFEGTRIALALSLGAWAAALGSPKPVRALPTDATALVADAAVAVRRATAGVAGIVRAFTLASGFAAGGSVPRPVTDLTTRAGAIAAAFGRAADDVSATIASAGRSIRDASERADQAIGSATSEIDAAAQDAQAVAADIEGARSSLEAAGRELLSRVVEGALASAADQVVTAVRPVTGKVALAMGALYARLVEVRAAAYDESIKNKQLLRDLLGPVPADACGPEWANALLLVRASAHGTCSVTSDLLAAEAGEVATEGGLAAAVTRWTTAGGAQPAPALLLPQIAHVVETGARAAILRLIDIDGLRQTLDDALRQLLPLRRRLTYDLSVPLQRVPLGFLNFDPTPDRGGAATALVLSSQTTIMLEAEGRDPLAGFKPKVTASVSGDLPAFDLEVPTVLTISFAPMAFRSGTNQPGSLSATVTRVQIGPSLDFLQKLQDLLGRRDQGPYVLLRQDKPAVEAGYKLAVGTFSLGTLSVLNINLATSILLPFDGSDARFTFSLGTLDQPFLLSAAPYGGGGFFGLEAGASGITAGAASFEYGGVAAISYGVLQGVGRITTGVYVRQSANGTELTGLFFAGFSAHIACFGIASSFTLRLTTAEGGLAGVATLRFSFSIGIASVSYSVSVKHHVDKGFEKPKDQRSARRAAGPVRYASLDTCADLPAIAAASIKNRGTGAAKDWYLHERYYDQSLRPAEL